MTRLFTNELVIVLGFACLSTESATDMKASTAEPIEEWFNNENRYLGFLKYSNKFEQLNELAWLPFRIKEYHE